MKKILITGAGGQIGKQVISYLLSESKYDITILDLKNKNNIKYFKKYENRLNIVFGDINDFELIKFLIRNQDVVIHLAGIMPPLSEYKNNLNDIINIDGTTNIINAIDKYNPLCHLIYPSTTSLYDEKLSEVTIKSKVSANFSCNYTKSLYKMENKIKETLKNYTIFRIPLVLGDNVSNLMYYLNPNSNIEVISLNDLAYAFTKSIDKLKILNKKIYNLSGGKSCQTTFLELKNHIYKIYGINLDMIKGKIINKKKVNSFFIKDSDILENILHFQNDSLSTIYLKIKNKYLKKTKRKIARATSSLFVKEK